MIANISGDILPLCDEFPEITITREFDIRDFAIEFPDNRTEEIQEFCRIQGIRFIAYPKPNEKENEL